MGEHFTVKCSCGDIITTCRCFAKDKTVTVVDNGCGECQANPKPIKKKKKAKAKS